MKKQISKCLILLLILQSIASVFFSKTYAAKESSGKTCEDTPPVCGATSPHMTTYIQFQKEVATFLSTNKLETAVESVKAGKGGLFTYDILKMNEAEKFDESLAGKTLRVLDITATRTATSLITTVFLFELAAIGALADNTIGITILFQDRPIVRDWTKLLDIEWKLSETAYNLGVVGDIGKTIEKAEALDAIVKKYASEGLFEDGAAFGSMTYMDVIAQLAQLNSAVKWFIAYDSKVLLTDFNNEYPQFKIKVDWINELSEEYKCARRTFGFKCNTSWASLKKNLQILTNNTKKQGKSSVQQIKDSYNDLKGALGNRPSLKDRIKGKDLGLSDREMEILRSRYGLNAERMTKAQGFSLISLNTNLKSQWNKLSKGVTTAVKGFKGKVDEYKELYNKTKEQYNIERELAAQKKQDKVLEKIKEANKNETNAIKTLSPFIQRDVKSGEKVIKKDAKVYAEMTTLLEKINTSKMDVTAMVNNTNNMDATKQYVSMLSDVEKLIKAIGNKEEGFRQQLNLLCTAQCSNRGNSCCYVK